MKNDYCPVVAIVGAGPAGLMAAEVISAAGYPVSLYERMASPARKFLMAGRGGLNITHSEPLEAFLHRYGDRETHLSAAIAKWTPEDTRKWCEELEQPTFVGTSGRVFPRAMKASGLLRSWLRRLEARGVRLLTRHEWMGWTEENLLRFATPHGDELVETRATILALGGGSWPRLGSNGAWTTILAQSGVAIAAFMPSNCGFRCAWSEHFATTFEGHPLKRISILHDGHHVRGELIITRSGIEGGAIYSLSASLRDTIARNGTTTLTIDLRPDETHEALARRLGAARAKQSLSSFLRKTARLPPVAIGLLHEAALASGSRLADLQQSDLADLVKAVPVKLLAPMPIDRAISTAGGIPFSELDGQYMLARRPGVFAAGEMLDWEAPTGGYLLQACLATGHAAGQGALSWLRRTDCQNLATTDGPSRPI